ncbi:MAG TPA: hypothetical protein VHB77_20665 [Planctomycetaceae bacterium]|nr:hypothetical protein [Planctomycetaceae bacterium]
MLRTSRWILALGCVALSSAGGCLALSIGGRTVNVPNDLSNRVDALEARVNALERQASASAGTVVITPNEATEQLPMPTSTSRATVR